MFVCLFLIITTKDMFESFFTIRLPQNRGIKRKVLQAPSLDNQSRDETHFNKKYVWSGIGDLRSKNKEGAPKGLLLYNRHEWRQYRCQKFSGFI